MPVARLTHALHLRPDLLHRFGNLPGRGMIYPGENFDDADFALAILVFNDGMWLAKHQMITHARASASCSTVSIPDFRWYVIMTVSGECCGSLATGVEAHAPSRIRDSPNTRFVIFINFFRFRCFMFIDYKPPISSIRRLHENELVADVNTSIGVKQCRHG
jgi:hypothetical protein